MKAPPRTQGSFSRWEVGGDSELGLGFEAGDSLAQGCKGALGSKYHLGGDRVGMPIELIVAMPAAAAAPATKVGGIVHMIGMQP
jgi:hypothetical protein